MGSDDLKKQQTSYWSYIQLPSLSSLYWTYFQFSSLPNSSQITEKTQSLYNNYLDPSKYSKPSPETIKKTSTIAAGMTTVATGAFTATVTGGITAVVIAPAMIGAGSALVIHPIMKYFNGEEMSFREAGKDAALYGTVGAVTGPIGAGGSQLARTTSGVTKVIIQTVTGSSAGAISGAIAESSKVFEGEQISISSVANSAKNGALVGTIGGACSVLSRGFNNISARIGMQGASAAVTDAGIQYHQKGEVDWRQTSLTAVSQATVATTAEIASVRAQQTQAYANKINSQRIDEDVKNGRFSRDVGENLKERAKVANKFEGEFTRKRVGDAKFHALDDRNNAKRGGQVAFNLGDEKNPARGILEKIRGKLYYTDYTADHNYKDCRPGVQGGKLPDPIEGVKMTTKLNGVILKNVKENEEGETKQSSWSYFNRFFVQSKL